MERAVLDLVLVGGSLTNSLIAWRLLQTRPDVTFMLLENGSTLNGSQTIWFRGTDVTKAQLEWLWVLCAKSFPSHDMERAGTEPRRIGGAFHCIETDDLSAKVLELAGERVRLRCEVKELHDDRVTLASGETIAARAVIDGRDDQLTPPWPHAFHEVFHAQIRSGLEVPVMGLRKTTPKALPTGGDAPKLERPIVGPKVGLFHATTGEVLPMAVDLAEVIPTLDLTSAALTAWLSGHVRRHWNSQGFYRALNARVPREEIFEKVHAQSDELIAHFYAGTSTMLQRLKLRFA